MVTDGSGSAPHERDDLRHGHLKVAVDDTEPGRNALVWATAEAASRGATLTVCHVRSAGARPHTGIHLATWELAEPALAKLVRGVRQHLGDDRVRVDLPAGEVTQMLLAATRDADLLVLGGHGPDPLRHRLASRVAAWAHCPVVVVRSVPAQHNGPFAGQVVVGVDGTVAARAALRFAAEHARRHRLPLAVVYVDHSQEIEFRYDDGAAGPLATELDAAGVATGDLPVTRAVYGGDPVYGLRQAAAGAALLVVGRHGDLFPIDLRLGSVAASFAAQADCPVAVVPGAGRWSPADGPCALGDHAPTGHQMEVSDRPKEVVP